MVESVITSLSLSLYVNTRGFTSNAKTFESHLVIPSHDDVSSTRILRVTLLLVTLIDVMVILKSKGDELFQLISGFFIQLKFYCTTLILYLSHLDDSYDITMIRKPVNGSYDVIMIKIVHMMSS